MWVSPSLSIVPALQQAFFSLFSCVSTGPLCTWHLSLAVISFPSISWPNSYLSFKILLWIPLLQEAFHWVLPPPPPPTPGWVRCHSIINCRSLFTSLSSPWDRKFLESWGEARTHFSEYLLHLQCLVWSRCSKGKCQLNEQMTECLPSFPFLANVTPPRSQDPKSTLSAGRWLICPSQSTGMSWPHQVHHPTGLHKSINVYTVSLKNYHSLFSNAPLYLSQQSCLKFKKTNKQTHPMLKFKIFLG